MSWRVRRCPIALTGRWAAATGSFFESVPAADAYLLKSILHDWPDDRCVEILRTCVRSLNPDGVVLVVETVLGRPGYEVEAAFSDLNMLVMPGGRERSEEEYAALFHAAGLRLTRVIDTGTRMSILEAQPRIVRDEMAPPPAVIQAVAQHRVLDVSQRVSRGFGWGAPGSRLRGRLLSSAATWSR